MGDDMHPSEWLRSLDEQPERYAALVEATGSVAAAAHRIATARCLIQAVGTGIPTPLEVRAAARTIAARLGLGGDSRTISSRILAAECERAGLPVIGSAA
jgi:hypothetical protein